MYVHRRRDVIMRLAGPAIKAPPRAKLCIAIAHIVGEEEAGDPVLAAPKIERTRQTVDGILMSFADCELNILASSLPNRSIVHFLPEYQRAVSMSLSAAWHLTFPVWFTLDLVPFGGALY
jgi:hypothetical protein